MKRTKIITLWVIAVALCATCVATSALAQGGAPGGPGGPGWPGRPGGPGGPPPPILRAGSDGVFSLLGGLLVKFDAATLQQTGTLQLLEKPAPPDGSQGDRPPMGPPPRGELLLASLAGGHEKVLALFGDQLFIVDAATLKLTAKVILPKLPAPPGQGSGDAAQGPPPPRFAPPMPMALELHGQMLYVLRGPQIVAVNIVSGTVVAQGMLPPPKPPEQ